VRLKVGSKSHEVKLLQIGLNSIGFDCGKPDGDFGDRTEDAVELFQASNSLYADGIAGKLTIAKFNEKVSKEFRIEVASNSSDLTSVPATSAPVTTVPVTRIGFKEVYADSKFGGFKATKLRTDVAERWEKLRAECVLLGGGVTTAGGIRALSAGGGAAQSATSLHYGGLAIDLSLGSGMNKTGSLYVVVRDPGNPRKWIVWMKCTDLKVPTVSLNAVICTTASKKTTLKEFVVTGKYVNFTELAAKYGFKGISARKSFLKGGGYTGAEWWHFQCEAVLTPGVSTFGEELLKVYSESEIKSKFKGDWDLLKSSTWKTDWF
jgi:hypothetical protein